MAKPSQVHSKCSRCGGDIVAGTRFCPSCGNDISSEVATLATARMSTAKMMGPELAQQEQLEHLRQATLGEYEIRGELGRGGMATVYLAHEIALNRKVAIKVMSPALVHGQGMVERFKREARTAASLSHPNIIPVYAVRETDRILYFVMKFVQGRTLDSIIKEVGALPIPMVRTILAQVGSAFGYAHRRGIVHRDIKPANIMIDDEGWAVVTDFGIAKVSESEALTMTGMTVGTPTYMSPEQCMAQEVTGASDQYSLGVVAYEMLTGQPPFVGGSMMAIMYGHFNDQPAPIQDLRPDCPDDLQATVLRMLEKDPARRWPGLDEAVASMGVQPLAHDDPTRSQLVDLARSGTAQRALLSRPSTPTSPIPGTWSRQTTPRGGGAATARPQTAAPPKRPAAPRPASAVVGSSQPPRSIKGLAIAGVVGGALAAGVLLYLAPWKWTRPAPVSEAAKSPAPPSAAPSVAESVAAKPTPPPVAASPAPNPEPVKEPRSESPARPAVDPAQVKRDRADYERMKSQATEARGRAASAGASAHDLSGGDLLRDQAASFAGRGRFSDALKPISDATTAYALAFSTAQARAATSTRFAPAQPATEALAEPPPARVPTSPAPVAAAPAASAETATRPSPQPSPAPSAATTQPAQPVDERPAVEQVVRDYARALAAGDVGGVLQVYPGLPSDVQKTLRDYFKEGWTLDTGHWRLSDIVVTGSTATVKIGGTTIVRDKRGKSSEQDPPNAATLERGPNGWKITALNGAK